MTDNEIIKALECCSEASPIANREFTMCGIPSHIVCKRALDLINRQRAKIEELSRPLAVELDNFASEYDSKIRAEAIKEIAERLKESKHECGCNYRKKPVYAVTEDKIDNLVKEMVGDSNAE